MIAVNDVNRYKLHFRQFMLKNKHTLANTVTHSIIIFTMKIKLLYNRYVKSIRLAAIPILRIFSTAFCKTSLSLSFDVYGISFLV